MSEDKPVESDYVIIVRPIPDSTPAVNRLRRLLKALLRGYGMRCLSIQEVQRDIKNPTQQEERNP